MALALTALDLIITGDVVLENSSEKAINELFEQLKKPLSSQGKLALSLEGLFLCPKFQKKSIRKDGPHLRSDMKYLNLLKKGSVVLLANNHILDYGQNNLLENLENFNRLGIIFAGVTGMNLDLTTVRLDNGISLINMSEQEFNVGTVVGASIINYRKIQKEITSEKAVGNKVVLVLHGGVEYCKILPPSLKDVCEFGIECGADLVVCSHPHVVGSFYKYKSKIIITSLGDTFFIKKLGATPNLSLSLGLINQKSSLKLFIVSAKVNFYEYKVDDIKEIDQNHHLIDKSNVYGDENIYQRQWESEAHKFGIKIANRLVWPFKRGLGGLSRFGLLNHKMLFRSHAACSRFTNSASDSKRDLLLEVLKVDDLQK